MLKKENIKIAVIGLGYVGLPLAIEFNKKYPVIGFDINKNRINELLSKNDINNEFSKSELNINKKSLFSCKISDLNKSNFFIVTVPTPIFKNYKPDLRNLISVSKILTKIVKKKRYNFF